MSRNYRIGNYRIREEKWGYVIEKRRWLLFWREVRIELTFNRAMRIVKRIQKED